MKKLIVLILMLFSAVTVFASKNEVVSSKLYGMWEIKSSDKSKKTLLLIKKSSDYQGDEITRRDVDLSDYSKKDTTLNFTLIKRDTNYYLMIKGQTEDNNSYYEFIKIIFTNSKKISLIDLGGIYFSGGYSENLLFAEGTTAIFKKKL